MDSSLDGHKRSGSKSIVSANPNIDVEDMKKIHPLVYAKLMNILSKSSIGGKIDDDIREEVNNLLQSYQKGKLSSTACKTNTILKQFASRFMKASNSPTKSNRSNQNKQNSPIKFTEADLYSVT